MRQHRQVGIATGVIVLHVFGLWAIQSGLLQRVVEVVAPAVVLVELIDPPQPKVAPAPQQPQKPQMAKPQQAPQKKPQLPPPELLAVNDPSPLPNASTGVTTPQPSLPAMTVPVQVAAAPLASPASPAAPKIELPSSDADYLQNPKPVYPAFSKRLGEQGRVLVRILIGVDGTAQKAEIKQSSGHDRLDQAALTTVQKWRYVPGKRAGIAEAMWFVVPINFVLE